MSVTIRRVVATEELVAGRELDALIAEKFMGRPRGMDSRDARSVIPHYSTDVAAALPVFEKLDEKLSDADVTWQIRQDARGWIVETFFGDVDSWGCEIFGVADTLPLAICRAAMAAIRRR